jgi:purine-binding chemotaxis protein CheW
MVRASFKCWKGEFAMAERQLVVFGLGDEEFGVDIIQVQEIVRLQEVTKIPNAPEFVEGIVNLRGRVIPLIDLRKRFGFVKVDHDDDSRIIVTSFNENLIGIIVDNVSEVIRLQEEQIEPPPNIVAGIGREYLQGVGKVEDRLVVLLELDRILNMDEKATLVSADLA